jgi:superfamily II DNA/RNA helicase
MSSSFAKLGLCEWIQKVSKKMGYKVPTPIQQ